MSIRSWYLLVFILLAVLGLPGCGGGGGSTAATTPPVITVAITPGAASVFTGATLAFSATVSNTSNAGVTWSVQEGAAGGTITSAGLYTAPASISGSSAIFHVVATSSADPSRFATTAVTVTPAPVMVSITPGSVSLVTGQTQDFSATVTNATNNAVTFSVQEGDAGGTLTSYTSTSTHYFAPGNAGTYHLVATSVADPSRSATAVVTVALSGIAVSISPTSANVQSGAQQHFVATVTGATDQRVYWTATAGSIDFDGLYTAPMTACTATIYATSAVDQRKGASATVTVLSNIAVGVSPADVTVTVGGSQTFVAQVTGGASSTVTWAVQEGVSGGAITSAGVYTAPGAPGTFHVTATSTEDGTRSATAVVHVAPALPVVLQAWPARAILAPGATQRFAASVLHATETGVNWSLQEGAAGGSVDAAGTYTAPAAKGVYHVVATAKADAGKQAILEVRVVDAPTGAWVATGSMSVPRNGHSATLLQDGKVLVVGGWNASNTPVPWASAELFDPATGVYTPTAGSLAVARAHHAAVLLPDGKVLIIGGMPAFSSRGTQNIDCYDPATGTFTPAGGLVYPRMTPAAVLLPDGRVFVVGGGGVNTAEIYDPASKVSRVVGHSAYARESETFAVLLGSGKVLVFGGLGGSEGAYKECELFDPATETFTPTGAASAGRLYSGFTVLQDGRVLNLGGERQGSASSWAFDYTCEQYDPATGLWTYSGNLSSSLMNTNIGTVQTLPDGRVLAVPGYSARCQIYNPATGTFQDGPGAPYVLTYPTMSVVLLDGRVLLMGGNYATGTTNVSYIFH